MSEIKDDYQEMKNEVVSAIKKFEAKHHALLFDKVDIIEIDTLNPNLKPIRNFDIKLTYNNRYLEKPR
jgi:hypothetical protein